MVKVIMHGCNGHMGQVITGLIAKDENAQIVAGIDMADNRDNGYPVFTNIKECQVEADVMIDFLKQFENLRLVLVNHGESQKKKVFAEKIADEVNPKRVGLLGREYFFRVDPYGLVKTLSTKFK